MTQKTRMFAGVFSLFLLLSFAGLIEPTAAQTVTVDLNKAKLAWDWTRGAPPNDGIADSFLAKCGRVAGVYTVNTAINDPAARTVNVRQVVNAQGVWFCVVSAENRYGSSGNTNEVSFDAGAAPAGPTNHRLQAQ